jgi:hypothetical protein
MQNFKVRFGGRSEDRNKSMEMRTYEQDDRDLAERLDKVVLEEYLKKGGDHGY